MVKKIILNSLFLIALISLFSCKKFIDVNNNPNNPDDASAKLLLPSAEAALSHVVGNNLQVFGGLLSQYWTQSPQSSQYKSLDRYSFTSAGFDRTWSLLYRSTLENLQTIIDKDNEAGITQHKAIAYILKAYSFQVLTDAFGDIPMAEALSGTENSNPKFDSQKIVYDSIFSLINQGKALLNNSDASKPGSEDLLFKGNMDTWKQFANTLSLRAYLRLSEIDPTTAKAGVAALYGTTPSFLAQDATLTFTTSGGNENPLYAEILGLGRTQNLVASQTAVKAYLNNNDPRLYAFYDKLSGQDTIAYIPQGSYNSFTTKRVSPPSYRVGGNGNDAASATAPVKLLSAAESSFLQAEVIARGWVSGSDQTLYEQGITRSFTALGLATSAPAYILLASVAYPTAGTVQGKVKAIITQKYLAMNGFQNFEAWTEWRRTGYPDFFTLSVAAVAAGVNKFPVRFLYPNSEILSNANAPAVINVFTPVWWDK